MKSTTRLPTLLRALALAVLVCGLAVWVGSGARVGWTQTSTVRMQTDEITGIEYPVRQPGFVAGLEVPVLAAVAAGVLGGLSFLRRAPRTQAA